MFVEIIFQKCIWCLEESCFRSWIKKKKSNLLWIILASTLLISPVRMLGFFFEHQYPAAFLLEAFKPWHKELYTSDETYLCDTDSEQKMHLVWPLLMLTLASEKCLYTMLILLKLLSVPRGDSGASAETGRESGEGRHMGFKACVTYGALASYLLLGASKWPLTAVASF